MAPKLIPLDEAARRLGISPDELTALRSSGKIFGYRDGSSWKFKEDELERYQREQQELAGGSGPLSVGGGRYEENIEQLVEPEDADNILVTEETEGASPGGTGSTVIGAKGKAGSGESDVKLAAGSGIGGSDVELVAGNSDVLAAAKDSRVGSDKDLAPLDLGQSDLKLGDELTLGGDFDLGSGKGEVTLGDEKRPSGGSSALDLDDDLVLGRGSGKGSDVTLGASDSGINLKKPNESGLALDVAPLDLAAGSNVDSLELGEDDMVRLDADADPDMATQLKADDDFLLTPVEEHGGQESDSGSQVIALDTDEFDQTSPTMLGGADLAAPLLEAEEAGQANLGAPGFDAAMPTTAGSPLMAPVMGGELPETPYTVWNVLSLFAVTLCMAFVGMLMVDLMRNMWSWEGTTQLNSAMMDKIISMIEGQ